MCPYNNILFKHSGGTAQCVCVCARVYIIRYGFDGELLYSVYVDWRRLRESYATKQWPVRIYLRLVNKRGNRRFSPDTAVAIRSKYNNNTRSMDDNRPTFPTHRRNDDFSLIAFVSRTRGKQVLSNNNVTRRTERPRRSLRFIANSFRFPLPLPSLIFSLST